MQIKCYVKKKNLRKSWVSYVDGGIVAFSCVIRWRLSLKIETTVSNTEETTKISVYAREKSC